MLKTETVTINRREFTHSYSDAGFKIRQEDTGIIYDEAYDVVEHTYTETTERIEVSDEDYAEAGRILLGEEATHEQAD